MAPAEVQKTHGTNATNEANATNATTQVHGARSAVKPGSKAHAARTALPPAVLQAAPLLFVREWIVVALLIFGGCCSNVYTLEVLVRSAPQSGNLITFAQFLLVALEGLASNIEFNAPDRAKQPASSQPISHSDAAKSDSHHEASGFVAAVDAAIAASSSPPASTAVAPTGRWRFPLRLRKRVIPLSRWMMMVALFSSVSVLTNYALRFSISMPVHIIFRSGSLLVSMIMSWLLFNKRFSREQVAGVVMVTIGIILSTMRSSSSSSTADDAPFLEWMTGIAVLTLALVLSCFLGQVQQQTYTHYGKQWREGLFYTHALSLPLFLFFYSDLVKQVADYNASPMVSVGDMIAPWLAGKLSRMLWKLLGGDFLRSVYVPQLWLYLSWNVATQYICISGVHKLSSMSTAVTLNLILTVRKFISLLLSVILFNNPFTTQNWIGAITVFIGTLHNIFD
eukprot:jgi/Hompol1/4656/HPOL_001519-RA